MSPLNIHPEEEVDVPKKKKNKTLKVMLGIAALVAVPVVGTTLAASIGINLTGNDQVPIQFGQGVAEVVACDSNGITLTPTASFDNDATFADASYFVDTVVLAGISDLCDGSTFTLKFYGVSSDTPIASVSDATDTSALIAELTLVSGVGGSPNTWTTDDGGATSYTAATGYSADASTLTFDLDTTSASRLDAAEVFRITVETSTS